MSLVDDLFTSARVEAESDVELVVLPRRPFELLVASDLLLAVKVYRAFCRTLSDRLRRANALPAARAAARERGAVTWISRPSTSSSARR